MRKISYYLKCKYYQNVLEHLDLVRNTVPFFTNTVGIVEEEEDTIYLLKVDFYDTV